MKYKVNVLYKQFGFVEVEADTVAAAEEIADEMAVCGDVYFDSWELQFDTEEME